MHKRPISVTIVAWVYIVMGAVGFTYHFGEFGAGDTFHFDVLGIELVRLLAIVCGAFLLRGDYWARWLALAWMGFHVVVSAFHSMSQLAMHCVFFALIAWLLFRPGVVRWQRDAQNT